MERNQKRVYKNVQGREGGQASGAVRRANAAAARSSADRGAAAAAEHLPHAAVDVLEPAAGANGGAAAADGDVPAFDDFDQDFDPVALAPAEAAQEDILFAPYDPDAILDRVLDEHFVENAAGGGSASSSSSSAGASSVAAASMPLHQFPAAGGQRIPLFDINSHANGPAMHPSGFPRYTGLGPGFVDCYIHDSEVPCKPHLVCTVTLL
jgi:hypothetical protein